MWKEQYLEQSLKYVDHCLLEYGEFFFTETAHDLHEFVNFDKKISYYFSWFAQLYLENSPLS